MVDQYKKIPPDVDRLILEHHEMPNGDGFPRGLSGTQISPLSCAFILSGLLAKYILHEKENFTIEGFVNKFRPQGYDRENFAQIFEVIETMKNLEHAKE